MSLLKHLGSATWEKIGFSSYRTTNANARAYGEKPITDSAHDEPLTMQRYFQENVFVFPHIEKTGGSAFVAGLSTILGVDHVHDIRGGKLRPAELSPQDLNKIWLFSGHFWFDTQEMPFARTKRYFITMRDPVDRFISHYNFVVASKSHPEHARYGNLGIAEAYRVLRNTRQGQMILFNRVTKMFGGREVDMRPTTPPPFRGRVKRVMLKKPGTLDVAKRTIEQRFVLAIPMTKIDDAIRGLGAAFGLAISDVERVNVGKKQVTDLPNEIRQEIIDGNANDYRLLAYIEKYFDRWLNDVETRLSRNSAESLAK